ncbi:calcium-binding protein [Microvirga brassicacearum]|nr:calcium-binding protein [Microvirga brassicacearum]
MTFSIEQAMAAYFDNSGGGGVWYGGTGVSGGPVTGNPTGGSGTGSSYPPPGGAASSTPDEGAPEGELSNDLSPAYNPDHIDIYVLAPKLIDDSFIDRAGFWSFLTPYTDQLHHTLYGDLYNCPHIAIDPLSGYETYGEHFADGHVHELPLGAVDNNGDGYADDSPDQYPGNTTGNSTDVVISFSFRAYLGTESDDLLSGSGWLSGGAGNDSLTGGAESDMLSGGDGNDILVGGAGADHLNGGAGFDIAAYENATSGVSVSLIDGTELSGDRLLSIEGLSGSSYNDQLLGDSADNMLLGNGGNDLLDGGDGADVLHGGEGDDTLVGGNGDDRLIAGIGNNILRGGAGADALDGTGGWGVADYHTAQTAVTVNLDGSGNSGDEAAGDTFVNVNGVQGSVFADTLNGNANANWILADSGNDTVDGGAGNDTVYGGDGDDMLVGGAGDDYLIAGIGNNVLRGGAGADKLDGTGGWGIADYHTAQTAVTVNLDNSGSVGDEAAGDTFVNVHGVQGSVFSDTLNGNVNANWILADSGNDTVNGGAGDDTVYGGDGDDQLVGGAGNDHLVGGIGNNVLEGGAGADILDGTGGWGVADYRNSDAVTLRLDGSGSSGGQAAGDVFINVNGAFGSAFGDSISGNANANWIIACDGNDTVLGGAGNDSLWGAEANDSLNGGADDDLLLGGAGSDVLTGGSGRDLFVFDAALGNGNVDRITDFNAADDTIQLDRGIFSAFGATVKFSFGQVASGGTAEIICNGGDLYYDADGLGGGLAVKFATVTNPYALTAADFLLI